MLRSAGWPLRTPRVATTSLVRTSHTTLRASAAVTDVSNFPQVGEQLHGFTLKRVKQVPELDLTALHLQHDRTGADYLHIAREDANNVFSIGFKTNPPDATGVPHILEHTTLCGSKRYATSRPTQPAQGRLTPQLSHPRPLLQDAPALAVQLHERLDFR